MVSSPCSSASFWIFWYRTMHGCREAVPSTGVLAAVEKEYLCPGEMR